MNVAPRYLGRGSSARPPRSPGPHPRPGGIRLRRRAGLGSPHPRAAGGRRRRVLRIGADPVRRRSLAVVLCPRHHRSPHPVQHAAHRRRAARLSRAGPPHLRAGPLLGTPISAESVTYALAQLLRFGSMAATDSRSRSRIAPGDIGPAFARLRGSPTSSRTRSSSPSSSCPRWRRTCAPRSTRSACAATNGRRSAAVRSARCVGSGRSWCR